VRAHHQAGAGLTRGRSILVLVAVTGLALTGCAHSAAPTRRSATSGSSRTTPSATTAASRPTAAAPSVHAALLPWGLPRPISREVVLASNGVLVLAGGLAADKTSTSGVFRLDPASGRLTADGSLAAPLHDSSGAVVGAAAYVFGGGAATTIASVQRIEPHGTASVVGRLPQPRSDLVAVTVGGQAVILGGYDGSTTTPDVLATSDGKRFRTVARLPFGVRYPAVAAVGNDVYLFGGEHGGTPIDAVQKIDVAAGTASVVGHLPAALSHAAAGAVNGRIVIAGGRSGGQTTDRVLVFDPATGRTTQVARLPRAVADAGCAVLGNSLWLVGGETPATVATVQRVTLG
jgi:hypothetical protein